MNTYSVIVTLALVICVVVLRIRTSEHALKLTEQQAMLGRLKLIGAELEIARAEAHSARIQRILEQMRSGRLGARIHGQRVVIARLKARLPKPERPKETA